jgi:hypothetical protein
MSAELQELSEMEAKEAGILVTPPTEDEEIEKSYTASDGHFWKETRLDPYGAQRQIAAQALGLRWGAMTKEDLKEFEQTNSYPGMFLDAMIVLYLCHPRGPKGKDGIDESYSACDPKASRGVRRRMMDWAAEQGITAESEEQGEAIVLMVKIVRESRINQFKPDGKKGTALPN